MQQFDTISEFPESRLKALRAALDLEREIRGLAAKVTEHRHNALEWSRSQRDFEWEYERWSGPYRLPDMANMSKWSDVVLNSVCRQCENREGELWQKAEADALEDRIADLRRRQRGILDGLSGDYEQMEIDYGE